MVLSSDYSPMKKLFGLLLMSILVGGTAQAFSDVTIGDRYYPATTYLKQVEVFKGYEDGSFGRDKLINRAEALKTIFSATETGLGEGEAASFNDVPADAWFAPYVSQAANQGIVSGDGATGNFAPGRSVNKAEFLKMLTIAFEIDPTAYELTASAADVPDDAWFAPYLKFALQFKVIKPDGANNASPSKELTRGEVAEIIFEMLHQGKGLEPQNLLNLTEVHLIKGLEFLEQGDIATAAILVSIAERFSTYAVELLPQNSVVLSANKVVEALKSIVSAYTAGSKGQLNEVVSSAKKAWNEADESLKLNPKNEVLSEKLKNIASQLANDAREAGAEG